MRSRVKLATAKVRQSPNPAKISSLLSLNSKQAYRTVPAGIFKKHIMVFEKQSMVFEKACGVGLESKHGGGRKYATDPCESDGVFVLSSLN